MNKRTFYFLSFTWGIPMTLFGLLVALVLLCCGKKPKRCGWCWYFEIGEGWGGIELGAFFLVSKTATDHTRYHEHGHAIQNCYWGLLMPFVIGIPSMIRYWYRELRYHRKGKYPPTDYDSIWFERQATLLGAEYVLRIERGVL